MIFLLEMLGKSTLSIIYELAGRFSHGHFTVADNYINRLE